MFKTKGDTNQLKRILEKEKLNQKDILEFLALSRENNYSLLSKEDKDYFIKILYNKLKNTNLVDRLKNNNDLLIKIDIEIYNNILSNFINPFIYIDSIQFKCIIEGIEFFEYYGSLIRYDITKDIYFYTTIESYFCYLLKNNHIDTIYKKFRFFSKYINSDDIISMINTKDYSRLLTVKDLILDDKEITPKKLINNLLNTDIKLDYFYIHPTLRCYFRNNGIDINELTIPERINLAIDSIKNVINNFSIEKENIISKLYYIVDFLLPYIENYKIEDFYNSEDKNILIKYCNIVLNVLGNEVYENRVQNNMLYDVLINSNLEFKSLRTYNFIFSFIKKDYTLIKKYFNKYINLAITNNNIENPFIDNLNRILNIRCIYDYKDIISNREMINFLIEDIPDKEIEELFNLNMKSYELETLCELFLEKYLKSNLINKDKKREFLREILYLINDNNNFLLFLLNLINANDILENVDRYQLKIINKNIYFNLDYFIRHLNDMDVFNDNIYDIIIKLIELLINLTGTYIDKDYINDKIYYNRGISMLTDEFYSLNKVFYKLNKIITQSIENNDKKDRMMNKLITVTNKYYDILINNKLKSLNSTPEIKKLLNEYFDFNNIETYVYSHKHIYRCITILDYENMKNILSEDDYKYYIDIIVDKCNYILKRCKCYQDEYYTIIKTFLSLLSEDNLLILKKENLSLHIKSVKVKKNKLIL